MLDGGQLRPCAAFRHACPPDLCHHQLFVLHTECEACNGQCEMRIGPLLDHRLIAIIYVVWYLILRQCRAPKERSSRFGWYEV